MPSYAAFLGHQPHISIAELSASIRGFSLDAILRNEILLFQSPEHLDGESLRVLGGTVAIARQVTENDVGMSDVPQLLANEVESVTGKVTFSLRTFGIPPKEIRDLYRECKQLLKRQGRPCRYVGSEREPAAAVLVRDEGLLDGSHGCEMAVIRHGENDLWVGKTLAVQDVRSYSKRDMKKPVRDTTVGLLPPKLAQILLNFGRWLSQSGKTTKPVKGPEAAEDFVIYDPFCGTGVIPMEALLRHWNVLASDSSAKAVTGCEKNLEWIRKEEKIGKKEVSSRVWKQDARKPLTEAQKASVIVTETTLGPSLTSRPTLKDVQKLKTENERLQKEFLEAVASSLPGVSVACTWPVWYTSKGPVLLEKIHDQLLDLGFQAVLPPGVEPEDPRRPTLVYRRPDQFVGREIVLLRSTKRSM